PWSRVEPSTRPGEPATGGSPPAPWPDAPPCRGLRRTLHSIAARPGSGRSGENGRRRSVAGRSGAGPRAGPQVRPQAKTAQTVLGRVPAEALGITLPHEHLLLDLRFLYRDPETAGDRGRGLEPLGLSNLYGVNYDWFSNRDNLHLTDEATAI